MAVPERHVISDVPGELNVGVTTGIFDSASKIFKKRAFMTC